jgi:hypothetical protein
MKNRPSSSLTCFRNLQTRQLFILRAYVSPSPLHLVPEIAQQNLPPYWPLLIPLYSLGNSAGHIPELLTFSPPACRPHFITSQQFLCSTCPPIYSLFFLRNLPILYIGWVGILKLNLEPFPGWLSAQILPPWASTIPLQMASPRPVPRVFPVTTWYD